MLYSKPIALWDAIIHYDRTHWRLALNVDNLFDREYVARCDGLANCIYGQGRQLMVSATWQM